MNNCANNLTGNNLQFPPTTGNRFNEQPQFNASTNPTTGNFQDTVFNQTTTPAVNNFFNRRYYSETPPNQNRNIHFDITLHNNAYNYISNKLQRYRELIAALDRKMYYINLSLENSNRI